MQTFGNLSKDGIKSSVDDRLDINCKNFETFRDAATTTTAAKVATAEAKTAAVVDVFVIHVKPEKRTRCDGS